MWLTGLVPWMLRPTSRSPAGAAWAEKAKRLDKTNGLYVDAEQDLALDKH